MSPTLQTEPKKRASTPLVAPLPFTQTEPESRSSDTIVPREQSQYGNAAFTRQMSQDGGGLASLSNRSVAESGMANSVVSRQLGVVEPVASEAPGVPGAEFNVAGQEPTLARLGGKAAVRKEVETPRVKANSRTPALAETLEAEAKREIQPTPSISTTNKSAASGQPKPAEEAGVVPVATSLEVSAEAESQPTPVTEKNPIEKAVKTSAAGRQAEATAVGTNQAVAPRAGAAAPAAPAQSAIPPMDTTSFEGVLQSLAATPPSAATEALATAAAATPTIQAQEKANLEDSFPQVERPSGLPRLEERKAPAPTGLEQGKPLELAEDKGREGKPPEVDHEEAQGPLPGKELSTEVREPPAEDEGSWWDQIFSQVQSFTASLPTRDPGVSTDAGPRPNVDLTGEANPNQTAQHQETSDAEVNTQRIRASGAVQEDFGENQIYPDVPEETLRPTYRPAPPPSGPAVTGKTVEGLAGPELAMFDQTTGPWYAGKVGEQQDRHRIEQEACRAKSEEARTDGERRISEETEKTRADQEAMQGEARGDVDAERERWRQENEKIQDDYATQSEAKRKEVDQQVTEKTANAEKEADQKLTEAETKAVEERNKAEAKAAEEKRKEEQKPRSWWQRVKGAISSVLNAIKKVVNAIFDGLRALVKGIFELAKKLVRGIIELARMAIVGLIKGFGLILKGLVTIALAAFPEAAKKARAWIDKRVDQAVTAVNKAAEALKKVTDAILDFVASTLDSLLGLVQSIQNAILTVVGMIITGEIAELIRRIGYLVEAAKTVPDQFETAALEELLGGNLDEPLSPMELMQAGIVPPQANAEPTAQPAIQDESQLPTAPWGEHNVGVDEVDHDMELSPELAGDLFEKTKGDGELELASSNDESRSMNAVMSEVQSASTEGHDVSEESAKETPKYPDDGLTPGKRAEIKWQMMKDGISKWWSDNWPTVLAAAAVALLGFIALNIVTGGAITAALPAILGIIGPLFIGVTVLKLAGNVKDYISQGWDGQIRPAGKSLAKGLAAGAIELISYLTFKAGGAALKGAKALATGGAKLARAGLNLAKTGLKAVARGIKFVIEKGKVLFRGIAKGVGKISSRARELGEKLLERLRFRKFRITISGRRFRLEGYINPWVLLADGTVDWREVEGRYNVGDVAKLAGSKERAIVIGKRGMPVAGAPEPTPSAFVEDLRALGPDAAKAKFEELKALGKAARKEMITGMSQTAEHARALRKAMVANGKVLKEGEHAHHIVPSTHARAEEARRILRKFDIDFNSQWNGAALSDTLHAPLHTNRYIDEVIDILRGARSRQAVIARLKKIEDLIKAGNFPPS